MIGLLSACQDHTLPPAAPGVQTLVQGLLSPIGMDLDASKRVWIGEAGTGSGNTSRVSMVGPNGQIIPVITGFPSAVIQGSVEGVSHILFADGVLYILHVNGRLYRANVSGFQMGNPPIDGPSLPSEDIGAFVIAQTNAGVVTDNPGKESHAYHAAVGPNGDLFMADAGANVIIRRAKSNGALSILANIPGFANPTPVGPPFIQSVPTGIHFDGQNLLVSLLTGFPFVAGRASVMRVNPANGQVSTFQTGFNPLTFIGFDVLPVVLEYGAFGQTGWVANSGRLVRVNTPGTTVIAQGLNRPTAFKVIDAKNYYVISLGDSALLRITAP